MLNSEQSAGTNAGQSTTAEDTTVSQPNANELVRRRSCKWYDFKPNTPANRQKLPPVKKYVLVRVKNLDECFPDPVCVGYLKYHSGVKSEPYFVTPGCTLEKSPVGDERILQWCDCLPEDFVWYSGCA
jgi:hypothetical protein